ncbi:MAG: GNAT family N-acetyltransferase [Enterovibrio sp.]
MINEDFHLTVDELTLRLVTRQDAEKIVAYYLQNRQHLLPWEPTQQDDFYTVNNWQRRLSQMCELQRHALTFCFLLFDTPSCEQVIGIISYNTVVRYPHYSANLGYSLAQAKQGFGIMHRALTLTNHWIFTQQHMHRLTATYMPRNVRSANVLGKQGFKIEGIAAGFMLINSRWEDHILTALQNPNWQFPQA